MPRIIGGAASGRRIAVPKALTTRPTADRAKEGLFGTLADLVDLEGARVADFYAGSGAVGLEMVSRGAAHCLLVEASHRVAAGIRKNAADLGFVQAEVVVTHAERLAAGPPPDGEGYDAIFLDPPYALPDLELDRVLADLTAHGWLTGGAVLAVERASRGRGPAWPAGVTALKHRRYGEATLWYARAA
ncbi:MAG: 16S rRNA (guanine(966)-N(2))-methyltransferase RsmD [Mycobacteriales bacterium]